jgi:hypothetical protein
VARPTHPVQIATPGPLTSWPAGIFRPQNKQPGWTNGRRLLHQAGGRIDGEVPLRSAVDRRDVRAEVVEDAAAGYRASTASRCPGADRSGGAVERVPSCGGGVQRAVGLIRHGRCQRRRRRAAPNRRCEAARDRILLDAVLAVPTGVQPVGRNAAMGVVGASLFGKDLAGQPYQSVDQRGQACTIVADDHDRSRVGEHPTTWLHL